MRNSYPHSPGFPSVTPVSCSVYNAAGVALVPTAHISFRERLSGRALEIRKRIDGTWEAYLFPNGDRLMSEGAIADDPVAAVVRLARMLQELPLR